MRGWLEPEPDAGIVVDEPDADSWACAIERYVSTPADTWGQAARRLVAPYAWDQSTARVVEALRAPRTPGDAYP